MAVSNYEPGGVRIFDADTLEIVADIPTGSKTIGLVDAAGPAVRLLALGSGRDLDCGYVR